MPKTEHEVWPINSKMCCHHARLRVCQDKPLRPSETMGGDGRPTGDSKVLWRVANGSLPFGRQEITCNVLHQSSHWPLRVPTSVDPFHDDFPLELCKATEHLHHHPTGSGFRFDTKAQPVFSITLSRPTRIGETTPLLTSGWISAKSPLCPLLQSLTRSGHNLPFWRA
jgi:hypothetical protein